MTTASGWPFFFSSRRRHTRWNCDWSSDVCSSDLVLPPLLEDRLAQCVERAVGLFVAELAPEGVGVRASGEARLQQEVGELVEQALEVDQIGRASCRERGWISGASGAAARD